MTTVVDVKGCFAGTAQLRLLGGFELSVDKSAVTLPLASQRLVAFVALQDRPLPRVQVAGCLWGHSSEAHASGCLRSALWRSNLVRPVLVAGRTHIRLGADVTVDVVEVAAVARRTLEGNGEVPCADARLLGRELLPGWYDDWVLIERERLRQLCLSALERYSASLLFRGETALAVDSALAAVQSEPLRETASLALIRAHLAAGNRSEALREFLRFETSLRDELGLRPSESLLHLVRSKDLLAPAG